MCTVAAVAAASGAASVRVWAIMSGGRRPRGGCPLPEGVHVDYPPFMLTILLAARNLMADWIGCGPSPSIPWVRRGTANKVSDRIEK
jgi:hypothetical protein